MKTRFLFLIGILAFGFQAFGQTEWAYKTFYDTRIVNGQSVETNDKGVMKMVISHRFGRLNGGPYELFGLDDANMRMGFDYGITKWLTIGVGRSSFQKLYDGSAKVKFLSQSKGDKNMPISASFFTNVNINSLKFTDLERKNYATSRFGYSYQLLLARKFHDRFSFQLMPTMVHRNLVATAAEKHDVFSIGAAARVLLTKHFTLNAEYYYTLPNQLAEPYKNSLSIGFDVDTKGHVFQLHFTNSRGMAEQPFLTETTGDWLKGDIHFGFNITRDFKITGRKYRPSKE